MGKSTIPWTHFTFNPWSGCSKVSAGCKNCYAAVNYSVKMRGVQWGPDGNRVIKATGGWVEPLQWNKAAAKAGERYRVFCASLADVFEGPETMPVAAHEPVTSARARLFELIAATPYLDWLLLTKRPENIIRLWPGTGSIEATTIERDGHKVLANVWLGVSAEDQETFVQRTRILFTVPAAVRFVSLEPQIGPVSIPDAEAGLRGAFSGVDCIIQGGESGPGARPFALEWARAMRDQCKLGGIAYFMKQLGSNATYRGTKIATVDSKGEAWSDLPADLQIRQLPASRGIAPPAPGAAAFAPPVKPAPKAKKQAVLWPEGGRK